MRCGRKTTRAQAARDTTCLALRSDLVLLLSHTPILCSLLSSSLLCKHTYEAVRHALPVSAVKTPRGASAGLPRLSVCAVIPTRPWGVIARRVSTSQSSHPFGVERVLPVRRACVRWVGVCCRTDDVGPRAPDASLENAAPLLLSSRPNVVPPCVLSRPWSARSAGSARSQASTRRRLGRLTTVRPFRRCI